MKEYKPVDIYLGILCLYLKTEPVRQQMLTSHRDDSV